MFHALPVQAGPLSSEERAALEAVVKATSKRGIARETGLSKNTVKRALSGARVSRGVRVLMGLFVAGASPAENGAQAA